MPKNLRPGHMCQVIAPKGFMAFDVLSPDSDDIHIETIAHALSNQCRFGGHCSEFYSVAQHSILVSYLCDRGEAMYGLLHDASEAYLVDIPSPLKHCGLFDGYLLVEQKLQALIQKKFGLREELPKSVKEADLVALSTERRDLMFPWVSEIWADLPVPDQQRIVTLSPASAKRAFLNRYRTILRGEHLTA